MEKRKVIFLANLFFLAALIFTNHLAWFNVSNDYYFPLLFGLLGLSYHICKPTIIFKNIISGYLIGWFIDVCRFKLLGVEESHLGEILAVTFPIIGHLWRNYRSTVSHTLAISGVSIALKYIATGIVWLFDKIFN